MSSKSCVAFSDLLEKKELTWLPWVGKEFDRSKVLVVAESHHVDEKDETTAAKRKKDCDGDPMVTCEMIAGYPLRGRSRSWGKSIGRLFNNILNVLCGSTFLEPEAAQKRAALWSRVAFMNLVQNQIWYKHERPMPNDFKTGWRAFIKVARIIKPDICIFFGVSAADYFSACMKEFGFDATFAKEKDKIGNCHPRCASVKIDGRWIPIRFVPSMFFSWPAWRGFVFSGCEEIRNRLSDLR